MLTTEKKNKIVSDFKVHAADTGSPEVQIALLTTRISEVTEHLKVHSKDHASRTAIKLEEMGAIKKKVAEEIKNLEMKGFRKEKYIIFQPWKETEWFDDYNILKS